MSQLVDAAFEQAAARVIQEAKQSGTPVIIWKDGRVRAVPCDELESPKQGRKRKSAGKAKSRRWSPAKD
jgi:hypothetical protein